MKAIHFPASPLTSVSFWLPGLLLIGVHVLFDWISYIRPLFGLNITPWNPVPAFGFVFWLRYGPRTALPWFAALMLSELAVRGIPGGWLVTTMLSLALVAGYGLTAEVLRHHFSPVTLPGNRAGLLKWLAIVAVGLILNDVVYISLLCLIGLVPASQWSAAFLEFGIGDIVGVLVFMPFIWALASAPGQARLWHAIGRYETVGYLALAALMLWAVFGFLESAQFSHFYFLFLPIIWAAARQGIYGAVSIAFVLQLNIVAIVRWGGIPDIPVTELQMLAAALALVGFFIGVVVDEQDRTAGELRQSMRLAAAGEMAAALAHELNQPLTALSAYGHACQHLLEKGYSGPVLEDTLGRMMAECGRTAEVVRRLRDFFRNGEMRLEAAWVEHLVTPVTQQFAAQLQEHGVELAIAPFLEKTVHVDRVQIDLVLRNLLRNALDAVVTQPPGQRRISLSATQIGGNRLLFSIEDSGQGVSAAAAARLFEPFVSSKPNGLGLGLVLSRNIVEAHGGKLWGEVGSHGVFRFLLPLDAEGENIGK